MLRSTVVNFGEAYRPFLPQGAGEGIDLSKFPRILQERIHEYKDVLASFTVEELAYLRWRMMWKALARVKQLPPEAFARGDKIIWGLRSGRGYGKTLAGSNWLGIEAASFTGNYAVVAPTKDDVRYIGFEGPTGLLSVIPPRLVVDQNRALPSITLWNGSIIRGFAGDTPERLRGPNHAKVWADEIASWQYPQEAWDNIMLGLRQGPLPQLLWTGTPKPSFFIRDLVKNKDSVVVVGSTHENKANLPKMFFLNIAKYEGTKIGRQEVYGEVLDPEEEGFVSKSDWQMWPADRPLPQFAFILLSLDTAFTEKTYQKKKRERDPTACTVWGLFEWPPHRVERLHSPRKKPKKHVMLLDAWEDWLSYPQLIKRVKKERAYLYGGSRDEPLIKSYPKGKKIDLMLIEMKGSGISLRQSLAVEDILTAGYNPGRMDKLGRLHVVTPLFSHGRVWAVGSEKRRGEFKGWAEKVISQVCGYTGPGTIAHDDLLDTTTQALRYFLDKFIGALTLPHKREDDEKVKKSEPRENPYAA